MTRPAPFWSRVDAQGLTDCWLWTGATQTNGYGSAAHGGEGRTALAHRVAYELAVGPIPAPLTVDHLCRNKKCCNPAHLELVTAAENTRRAAAANRPTHCPQGHEYSADNTYIKHRSNGQINRACKQCRRMKQQEYRARRAVAA